MPRIPYQTDVQTLEDIPGFDYIARDVQEACESVGADREIFFRVFAFLANKLITKAVPSSIITHVIDPIGTNRSQYFENEKLLIRQHSFRVARDGLFIPREDLAAVLAAHLNLDLNSFFEKPNLTGPFGALIEAIAVVLMHEAAENSYPIMLAWGAQSEKINIAVKRLQNVGYKLEVVVHEPIKAVDDLMAERLKNRRFFEFRTAAEALTEIMSQIDNLKLLVPYHLRNANTVRIVHQGDGPDDYVGDVAFRDEHGRWDIRDVAAFDSFKARYGLAASSMIHKPGVELPRLQR